MRLLIYGSTRNRNTIASFFIRNLEGSIAYDVLRFPDKFASLLDSKVYRLIYRVAPWSIIHRMDVDFLRQVADFRPTVVLIFKGMEISRRSLNLIRDMGIKLVNYNFDHPFEFFSRGTGNRFVEQAIPSYDLHISYSSFIASELRDKYNVNTACIPFGFHLTDDQYTQVLSNGGPEIRRACFVGNPDSLRVSAIKHLAACGIPVSLYGFGWEKHFSDSVNVEIHLPRRAGSFWVDPLEFWKVLRQYRLQLNFFRPHNVGSHNLRSFEVPAVGGILLTPHSIEQQTFFAEGEEIFSYSDLSSLTDRCRYLLEADYSWVTLVRERARKRSVLEDYSYRRRTNDLVKLLTNLQNN